MPSKGVSPHRRFIPTPMGNSREACRRSSGLTVHPHAGGELFTPPNGCSSWYGSSPRRWGTRDLGMREEVDLRFIPAPVGNSPRGRSSSQQGSVHPHTHGELGRCPNSCEDCFGSSPRPWGTPLRREVHHVARRFIPTPVGNSPG